MDLKVRFAKAKWLAMLFCLMAAIPTVSPAQEINPIQAFIDSVALANTEIAPDGTKRMKRVTRATVTVLDLSLARYASYKKLTYTLDVTTSIKVINGTIGAADGFKGDRSGNAVAPLVRVKNGATLYIDATAAVDASTLATTVCPAAVALYDCSTLSHGGTITAPDNGIGVAIYLDSDCCTLTDDGGSTNGTTVTNGTMEPGIAIDATNFPDENFRNYLLAQDYGTDAWLTYTEIDAIKELDLNRLSYMLISNYSGSNEYNSYGSLVNNDKKIISNLRGIEYFTALEYLGCNGNELVSLDLTHNSKLVELDCRDNKLKTISLTANNNLQQLLCSSNELTSLDLTNYSSLKRLVCFSNKLVSLDMTGNSKLTYLNCSLNELQQVNVAGCVNLDTLICSSNVIENLNLTNQSKLVYCICKNNKLSELLLPENKTSLYDIDCSNNLLTSIDVTSLSNLTLFNCANNHLYHLDLSKNSKLEEMRCLDNHLMCISLADGADPGRYKSNGFYGVGEAQTQTLSLPIVYFGNNKYGVKVPDDFNANQLPGIRIVGGENNDNNTVNAEGYLIKEYTEQPSTIEYDYCYHEGNTSGFFYYSNYLKVTITVTGVENRILGDVNADGFVTISDPVSIFGWLMEQPQQVFVEEAADYNRDNVITISDGVSIIAYLMDGKSQASRRAASSMETSDDIMLNVADNGFGLALANEREFTAFTMDITLPEGEALRSVKLDSRRSNGHAIGWQRLHNGIYRVICYSPVMQPFAGTDGALVCFETDGAFSGNVTVDNITFVDTNCNEKSMESLNHSADGISEPQMSSAPSAPIYDLGGRRITSPRHGIYVQKGRKLVVKEVK